MSRQPVADRSRGAVLVWVLPAIAVLAAATFWWLVPGNSTVSQRPANSASSPTLPANSTAGQMAVARQVGVREMDFKSTANRPVIAVSHQKSPIDPIHPRQWEVKVWDQSATEIARGLTGEWTGYYQGQREMQVSADGTGTMVSYPEGLAATFLAAKLTFDFRWTLDGDQLQFETVGGEPADKVNVVMKMYGRRRSHKILQRHAEELVLLDEDGVTKYLWKRVARKSKGNTSPEK